jgi:hypothetical protein
LANRHISGRRAKDIDEIAAATAKDEQMAALRIALQRLLPQTTPKLMNSLTLSFQNTRRCLARFRPEFSVTFIGSRMTVEDCAAGPVIGWQEFRPA